MSPEVSLNGKRDRRAENSSKKGRESVAIPSSVNE